MTIGIVALIILHATRLSFHNNQFHHAGWVGVAVSPSEEMAKIRAKIYTFVTDSDWKDLIRTVGS